MVCSTNKTLVMESVQRSSNIDSKSKAAQQSKSRFVIYLVKYHEKVWVKIEKVCKQQVSSGKRLQSLYLGLLRHAYYNTCLFPTEFIQFNQSNLFQHTLVSTVLMRKKFLFPLGFEGDH